MDISIKRGSGHRYLELGGGAAPLVHPTCMGGPDVNVDVRHCHLPSGQQTTDFTADFNEPLPIATHDFDGLVCRYCLEHLSWRKVRQFLGEMLRVVKPGHRVVIITSNVAAQIAWLQAHPQGWDGKGFFESASCLLYGDQDYPENSHRCYFTPEVLQALMEEAGFVRVATYPHGARDTDLRIEALTPSEAVTPSAVAAPPLVPLEPSPAPVPVTAPAPGPAGDGVDLSTPEARSAAFDRHYFDGGGKVGGYAREGYRDFPVHEVTLQHLLDRKPASVLEIGAARGYLIKRLVDRGIPALGLEISRHCYLTRADPALRQQDLCLPWALGASTVPSGGRFDLAFSVATFEHIPEEQLPEVIRQLGRWSQRGLHGIDFGDKDDGWDRTHVALRPHGWWLELFNRVLGPGHGQEIVDKETLEAGPFPATVLADGGLVKLNIGCATVMHHHGWRNLDILDLAGWAQPQGYLYTQCDVRGGIPAATGGVDLIHASHFLEHLSYDEGLRFLKECRRVLKPGGTLRLAVPDAQLLQGKKAIDADWLVQFGEINAGVARAATAQQRLWALLHEGHQASYDWETLQVQLRQAGLTPHLCSFRRGHPTILRETQDMFPDLTLYAEGHCTAV